MRFLLTGASSFTGAWFATTLALRGHKVSATLQRPVGTYEAVRAERISVMRQAGVTFVEQCSFGDDAFLDLAAGGFDLICHHAADVTNYRSYDFDVAAALANNTRRARDVLETALRAGTKGFLVTGSVFEQDEGAGELPLRAFSPYGLSKGLTWASFGYWGRAIGLPVSKFVIPNPFGAMEEPRFCAHLMRCWAKGERAEVRTPSYIRDNIPIDLLARAYSDFAELCGSDMGVSRRLNPSGYVESQGAFAQRFARQIGGRLGLAAELILVDQSQFDEPVMRVNTDRVTAGWDEEASWNTLAEYYRRTYL